MLYVCRPQTFSSSCTKTEIDYPLDGEQNGFLIASETMCRSQAGLHQHNVSFSMHY